ncbi:MAG: branched-chain-amino-acid transaminase [Bacteroidetes bacterium]|nr:branched-chain-amino-acid transaminase [Bacteroidota bacterium]
MLYHTDKTKLFFNGEFRNVKDFTISPYNQTLHYGYGVFDGIRAYKTKEGPHIFKVRRHFERFVRSTEKMEIRLPYTSEELINYAYELIEKNNMEEAYIRPLAFMDKNMTLRHDNDLNEVNVMMTCWKWNRYFESNHLNLHISSFRRPHPKTVHIDTKVVGHYVNSILATREAQRKGYDDALMLDVEGYVAQGPGAAIFFENNGRLYTAPLGNVYPSITRQTLMEIAKAMGIEVIEKQFGPEDILTVDGAFFAGTATEVAGIASINGHELKLDWEDTIGYLLYKKYKKIVTGKDTSFLEYF